MMIMMVMMMTMMMMMMVMISKNIQINPGNIIIIINMTSWYPNRSKSPGRHQHQYQHHPHLVGNPGNRLGELDSAARIAPVGGNYNRHLLRIIVMMIMMVMVVVMMIMMMIKTTGEDDHYCQAEKKGCLICHCWCSIDRAPCPPFLYRNSFVDFEQKLFC